jgi:hypothetical protein
LTSGATPAYRTFHRHERKARDRLAVLDRRTGKLDARGIYSGPVDNRQIKLGDDPAGCANQVARWNGAGTSLGCVPPAT